MKNFHYTRRSLFSGPHLIGLIFLAAGLFTLLSPAFLESDSSFEQTLLIGTIVFVLGLLIVSFYEGTKFDFHEKRIKEYTAFLGYQFGKWQPLPHINRIAVKSVTYKASNTPNGISPTMSGRVTDYTVFVYTNTPKPVYSFSFPKEGQALKAAKLLSVNLGAAYEVKEA